MSTTTTTGIPSTVLSTALHSATAHASCPSANLTNFPTNEPACAVASTSGVPSNTTDVLSSCCKSAGVEKFNGACGYYCLSLGQKVAKLQGCFQDSGISSRDIYCNAKSTESSKGDTKKEESKAAVSGAGVGVLGLLVGAAFAGLLM